MELFQIVYVSSATHPFSQDELLSILEISRRNNARVGVTGMLLYREGNIIQVLEGPVEQVRATYDRIERDPRHHGIIVLAEGPTQAREFTEWSMGFREVRADELQDIPGFSDHLLRDYGSASPGEREGAAHQLLRFFPKIAR